MKKREKTATYTTISLHWKQCTRNGKEEAIFNACLICILFTKALKAYHVAFYLLVFFCNFFFLSSFSKIERLLATNIFQSFFIATAEVALNFLYFLQLFTHSLRVWKNTFYPIFPFFRSNLEFICNIHNTYSHVIYMKKIYFFCPYNKYRAACQL